MRALLLALVVGRLFANGTKLNPSDGLTYVWIPPGTFAMGCSGSDTECDSNEKPAHQVSIGKGFWIGQAPVTQDAYQRVTGKSPGYFWGTKFPVESVTWDEAQTYCEVTGARLPTEEEWEYAARAGSTASRYGELGQIAWFGPNSGNKTHDVMQKQPNVWDLFDMLGDVWQWTADWLESSGPSSPKLRVLRGGSWANGPAFVRFSVRSGNEPDHRSNVVGFRCVAN